MTAYRSNAVRKKIVPPWGTPRDLGRTAAKAYYATVLAGSVSLAFAFAPVAGIAAALFFGLPPTMFLFGGSGPRLAARRGSHGEEQQLVEAGLDQVTLTEWRSERSGFPVRVVFSRHSLASRIELALGSVPSLAFEAERRSVDGYQIASDRPDLARDLLAAAVENSPPIAPPHQIELRKQVLRGTIDRAAFGGYEDVLSLVTRLAALASALADRGEGLAPFEQADAGD